MLPDVPIALQDIVVGLALAVMSWGGYQMMEIRDTQLVLKERVVQAEGSLDRLAELPQTVARVEAGVEYLIRQVDGLEKEEEQ